MCRLTLTLLTRADITLPDLYLNKKTTIKQKDEKRQDLKKMHGNCITSRSITLLLYQKGHCWTVTGTWQQQIYTLISRWPSHIQVHKREDICWCYILKSYAALQIEHDTLKAITATTSCINLRAAIKLCAVEQASLKGEKKPQAKQKLNTH